MSCNITASVQRRFSIGFSFAAQLPSRNFWALVCVWKQGNARFIFGILQLLNELESNLGRGLWRLFIWEMGVLQIIQPC